MSSVFPDVISPETGFPLFPLFLWFLGPKTVHFFGFVDVGDLYYGENNFSYFSEDMYIGE